MDGVAPPGWPAGVHPPGVPGWEDRAVAWLLDQCPPEYRGYAVLRRHPVVLARFALLHVEGCRRSVRDALSRARGELGALCPPGAVDAAVEAWQCEDARLIGVARATGLVEEALRGRRFARRL